MLGARTHYLALRRHLNYLEAGDVCVLENAWRARTALLNGADLLLRLPFATGACF